QNFPVRIAKTDRDGRQRTADNIESGEPRYGSGWGASRMCGAYRRLGREEFRFAPPLNQSPFIPAKAGIQGPEPGQTTGSPLPRYGMHTSLKWAETVLWAPSLPPRSGGEGGAAPEGGAPGGGWCNCAQTPPTPDPSPPLASARGGRGAERPVVSLSRCVHA